MVHTTNTKKNKYKRNFLVYTLEVTKYFKTICLQVAGDFLFIF